MPSCGDGVPMPDTRNVPTPAGPPAMVMFTNTVQVCGGWMKHIGPSVLMSTKTSTVIVGTLGFGG